METKLNKEKFMSIYERLLRDENKKNEIERYQGYEKWFSASSAGHCIKKHKFKQLLTEADEIDSNSLYKMRLGTLVHDDIQSAIKLYYNDHIVATEMEIELPELNVRGYLDIGVINDDSIELMDIKTMHSYSWKLKFGREKNRDKNPSTKYELQLGTYALGIQKRVNKKVNKMTLIYYKKDDSLIKFVDVPLSFMDKAREYWEDVNKMTKKYDINTMVPGEFIDIPVEEWECKFCQYASKCNSPFKGDK